MIKVGKPDSAGAVRVTFSLPDGEPAGPVSVVGDFNGWDPFANPLRARRNGARSCVVKVLAGSTLHFRYLADGGVWFNDDTIVAGESQDAAIAV
jgi:hypothetical protein